MRASHPRTALLAVLCVLALFIDVQANASTPSSGTIGEPPDPPSVAWTGPTGSFLVPGPNPTNCQDEGEPSHFDTHPGSGGVLFDSSNPPTFQAATIVSAHFLGAEPQETIERPVLGGQPGAVDPNRMFIDWPLSSRTEIGQISRSLDGGNTFRLLLDLTCAERSRPDCTTGGGGDTEEDVNPFNG